MNFLRSYLFSYITHLASNNLSKLLEINLNYSILQLGYVRKFIKFYVSKYGIFYFYITKYRSGKIHKIL